MGRPYSVAAIRAFGSDNGIVIKWPRTAGNRASLAVRLSATHECQVARIAYKIDYQLFPSPRLLYIVVRLRGSVDADASIDPQAGFRLS
jgi:hypothetical protein